MVIASREVQCFPSLRANNVNFAPRKAIDNQVLRLVWISSFFTSFYKICGLLSANLAAQFQPSDLS
jgi:hypothetical protein